jgi:hypothetical protein
MERKKVKRHSVKRAGRFYFRPCVDCACLIRRFLRRKSHNSNISMSDLEVLPLPLQLFTLKDGVVASNSGQEAVNNYAADFQGLRHFGLKVGECLELGAPWMGTLQEEDFTLNFAYFDAGTDAKDPGAGALIGERVPMFELLTRANSLEA